MINRQEVLEFSKEFGLSAHIIEKDYVLSWLLAGIASHSALQYDWIFKGGTCLKKCFFETYRFSEDLDFTIANPDHLDDEFLRTAFDEVVEWVYEESGNEMPSDRLRFEVYENPRGAKSIEGRVYYRGPLQRGGDLSRIKLDLTHDEVVVLDPTIREVHHPYSDKPEGGFHVQCYCLEESFAEKLRALVERLRPRDLYDVVNLYRHSKMCPDRAIIKETLHQKCKFKGIPVPTIKTLDEMAEREELEAEWENMLAHQLPMLPPIDRYWHKLPAIFEWLTGVKERIVLPSIPVVGDELVTDWQPPSMIQAWNLPIPFEIIRFAAANRLCVDLEYQDTHQLIEPYSLLKTKGGNILLYAIKYKTGEARSYRIDKIQGAQAANISFSPKYTIDLN